jgi:hypothetical protein
VAARGIERRRLFDEEREWERFLAQLAGGVELDGVRLYLFCLMINHVHLVLETPRANVGRFMHRLQTACTVYYNRRHERARHLMASLTRTLHLASRKDARIAKKTGPLRNPLSHSSGSRILRGGSSLCMRCGLPQVAS